MILLDTVSRVRGKWDNDPVVEQARHDATARERRRLFSLDVLRGVAIGLVLIRHMLPPRSVTGDILGPPIVFLRQIGWCGVDLFFVLSGFLISNLIFDEYRRNGRFRLGRFWLRRGFRIWPAYYFGYGSMFVARVGWAMIQGEAGRTRTLLTDGFWNAAFLQNYVSCERWPHSWSLAVEEHFYMGLPLVLTGLWYMNRRVESTSGDRFRGLRLVASLVFVIVFWRRWQASFPTMNWHAAYYRTHMRIDALFAGVLLGYVYTFRWSWIERFRGWIPLAATATLMCGIVPAIWTLGESPWCTSFGFSLLWIGYACIVMAAARYPQAGSEGSRLITVPCRCLAWLGIYSYTIYIGHSILFGLPGVATLLESIQERLRTAGVASVVSLYVDRVYYLVGSIGLGLILAHFVERPFLRLRSQLVPSQKEIAPA